MKLLSIAIALSAATLVFAAPPPFAQKHCGTHPGKAVGHRDHEDMLRGTIDISLDHLHGCSDCKPRNHQRGHGRDNHPHGPNGKHGSGKSKHPHGPSGKHTGTGVKHEGHKHGHGKGKGKGKHPRGPDGKHGHKHTGVGCKHESHKKTTRGPGHDNGKHLGHHKHTGASCKHESHKKSSQGHGQKKTGTGCNSCENGGIIEKVEKVIGKILPRDEAPPVVESSPLNNVVPTPPVTVPTPLSGVSPPPVAVPTPPSGATLLPNVVPTPPSKVIPGHPKFIPGHPEFASEKKKHPHGKKHEKKPRPLGKEKKLHPLGKTKKPHQGGRQ